MCCLKTVSYNAGVSPLLCCIAEHSMWELQFFCTPWLCIAKYVQHRDGQDLWSVVASTLCSSSQNPCLLMMWLEAHRTCLTHPSQPATSLPQPPARPLISEQGNGPVVMTGALAGAHWRPQCKEKIERIILWGGHRDLSWGIAGDLMVEGLTLECSGSGHSLRLEQ